MSSIVAEQTVSEQYEFVIGVDTHAATHTFALVAAATGGVLAHAEFAAYGLDLHHAVKATIFLADINDLQLFNHAYMAAVPGLDRRARAPRWRRCPSAPVWRSRSSPPPAVATPTADSRPITPNGAPPSRTTQQPAVKGTHRGFLMS